MEQQQKQSPTGGQNNRGKYKGKGGKDNAGHDGDNDNGNEGLDWSQVSEKKKGRQSTNLTRAKRSRDRVGDQTTLHDYSSFEAQGAEQQAGNGRAMNLHSGDEREEKVKGGKKAGLSHRSPAKKAAVRKGELEKSDDGSDDLMEIHGYVCATPSDEDDHG
jgi:hypothetical protein